MRRCILFRHRPVRTFEGEWPRTAPGRRRQSTTLEERFCSPAEASGACAHRRFGCRFGCRFAPSARYARCDASALARSLTWLVSSLVNQGESGFAAAPDIRCEDSVTDDEVVPTGT